MRHKDPAIHRQHVLTGYREQYKKKYGSDSVLTDDQIWKLHQDMCSSTSQFASYDFDKVLVDMDAEERKQVSTGK